MVSNIKVGTLLKITEYNNEGVIVREMLETVTRMFTQELSGARLPEYYYQRPAIIKIFTNTINGSRPGLYISAPATIADTDTLDAHIYETVGTCLADTKHVLRYRVTEFINE